VLFKRLRTSVLRRRQKSRVGSAEFTSHSTTVGDLSPPAEQDVGQSR
jgi:hypothetical protein